MTALCQLEKSFLFGLKLAICICRSRYREDVLFQKVVILIFPLGLMAIVSDPSASACVEDIAEVLDFSHADVGVSRRRSAEQLNSLVRTFFFGKNLAQIIQRGEGGRESRSDQ